MDRPVNEGFSGGEKKRNEISRWHAGAGLAILDETIRGWISMPLNRGRRR